MQELEIIKNNPFASIDQAGVGQLMKIAVEKGNQTRPGIKLGICGEHGGDPTSVKFCHKHRPDLRYLQPVSACRWPVWPPRRPPSKRKPPKRRRRSNLWRRPGRAPPTRIYSAAPCRDAAMVKVAKPLRETGAALFFLPSLQFHRAAKDQTSFGKGRCVQAAAWQKRGFCRPAWRDGVFRRWREVAPALPEFFSLSLKYAISLPF